MPPRHPSPRNRVTQKLLNDHALNLYRLLAAASEPVTVATLASCAGTSYMQVFSPMRLALDNGIVTRTVVGKYHGRDLYGYELAPFGHAILADPLITGNRGPHVLGALPAGPQGEGS